MYESVKMQCRGILSLTRNTRSYMKYKIGLIFILIGANNNIRQKMKRMNQYHNRHNLQIKEILMTITWPHMGTFTLS